eukprot:gene2635-2879_t
MTEEGITIGIDLGSIYSRAAVWKRNHVEVLVDDQGHRSLPSMVSFADDEVYVGEEALNQIYRNPFSTIFEVKQFIGRPFHDPRVQSDMKRWPYVLTEDEQGRPAVTVDFRGETKCLTAEDISAYIIAEVKEIAETALQQSVSSAVIAVPATFTYSQRHATSRAAAKAGLTVLRTLSAVEAAAIAYGSTRASVQEEHTVLIFDFGGGSLDMAVAVFEEGICEVKAIAGDSHLGGVHLDQLLVDHCMDEFRKLYGEEVSQSPRALRRLFVACEKAKRTLSKYHQSHIDLDSLLPGKDLNLVISRALFQELGLPIFQRAVHLVDRLLYDAKLTKEKIDDLVLVGGSSRIPKLQEMLSEHLGGRTASRVIDRDEAIVCGAALQAAVMTGDQSLSASISELLLLEVVPLSLGVETVEGMMTKVIRRNSTLPAKKTITFTTTTDNQSSAAVRIFQGEHGRTEENHFLGEFLLEGLPQLPKGQVLIDVTFDLDANAVLLVTAIECSTGLECCIDVTGEQHPTLSSSLAPIAQASEYPHKRPLED